MSKPPARRTSIRVTYILIIYLSRKRKFWNIDYLTVHSNVIGAIMFEYGGTQ